MSRALFGAYLGVYLVNVVLHSTLERNEKDAKIVQYGCHQFFQR